MTRLTALILTFAATVSAMAGGKGLSSPVELVPAPRKIWEISVETVQTIGVDNATDNYFSTQFVSFAIEPFRPLVLGPVTMRTQLLNSFVVSAILDGPDNYYVGWAPQLRAIFPLGDSRWSLYTTFGAGLGVADAKKDHPYDGGLGQPFTFLLTANAGLRYSLPGSWSVWAGGAWVHFSNGEQSEPEKENIGIDSFGVVLGAGWAF